MNNEIIMILNHIENLGYEDAIRYLFECSFVYENNEIVYDFIFKNILKYFGTNKDNTETYIIKKMDKKILINALYFYKFDNSNILKGPLSNILYVLSNDNLMDNIIYNIIIEYLDQLKLLLKNNDKKLEYVL